MAAARKNSPYELFYWPGIPGRGEYVRLALEEAGAPYVDVARERDTGMDEMMALMEGEGTKHPSFAPPFLRDGRILVGQVAAILLYLGPRLGLAPKSEASALWTNQIQLTITDFVAEAHDVHHPISVGLYYEDQKKEAARRADDRAHHPIGVAIRRLNERRSPRRRLNPRARQRRT